MQLRPSIARVLSASASLTPIKTWLQKLRTSLKDPNAHAVLYNLGASYDFGFTKLYGNLVYKNGSKAAVRDTNPNIMVYSVTTKTPLFGGNLLNGLRI